MRIAVVQHRVRDTADGDREALVSATLRAVEAGAAVLVLPGLISLSSDEARDALRRQLETVAPGVSVLIPYLGPDDRGSATVSDFAPLGRAALLVGDACIDPEALAAVATEAPVLAVLAPRSESDLQAEAALEVAIGLSTSLVALVIVVEPDGAEVGEPGHGGSAIIFLDEVLAEATSGDEVLVAEIDVPIGPAEPRAQLPAIPPVLQQRLAAHRGRKLEVDYPADLD